MPDGSVIVSLFSVRPVLDAKFSSGTCIATKLRRDECHAVAVMITYHRFLNEFHPLKRAGLIKVHHCEFSIAATANEMHRLVAYM